MSETWSNSFVSESCVGVMSSPLIVIEKRFFQIIMWKHHRIHYNFKVKQKCKVWIFANARILLISKLKKIWHLRRIWIVNESKWIAFIKSTPLPLRPPWSWQKSFFFIFHFFSQFHLIIFFSVNCTTPSQTIYSIKKWLTMSDTQLILLTIL